MTNFDPTRALLSPRQAYWLAQLAADSLPAAVPYHTMRSLKACRLVNPSGSVSRYGRAWLEDHPDGTNASRNEPRGRAGHPTYHRILDAVQDALAEADWYDVTVRDVAARAEVKLATFHHYFETIPHATRALLARKAERETPLTEHERRLGLLLNWEAVRREPEPEEETE